MSKCLECQQVKGEYKHPIGLLQPLKILEWKWETISMDFIIGFPNTDKQHDAIMVVVDNLNKVAHFVSIKYNFKSIDVVDIL
jgi:hypothetical protein